MSIDSVVRLLQDSKRPLFVWGSGIRPYAADALELARSLGIPVACTWGAIDLIHHDDPLFAGGFGTHGTRAANFAVQNADLLISIGSRLDTKSTGQCPDFARHARIVMVDIDEREIRKFDSLGRTIDIPLCMDAGEFIESIPIPQIMGVAMAQHYHPYNYVWPKWLEQIQAWRKRYDTPVVTWPGINPYELMKEIAKWTTPDDIIVSDTGTVLGYIMQGFPFKGERFLHAFNMTPMGYGLPAAIGASFATARRVLLVTGDGSLMMSLSELATVARWGLNIKIILLNNQGHAMCRQTQRQWLNSSYHSTSVEGGLGFPDFYETARAFGIESYRLGDGDWAIHALPTLLAHTMKARQAAFFEIPIHPDAHLMPQAAFGYPLEDGDPKLSREELREQMLIPLVGE